MREWTEFEPRDWAFCGVFGGAGLLLPPVFHLLHLGHVFLPIYLPMFALAFLVRPFPCGLTAALVPLLSAVLTGMPPLYPPIAWVMSIELAVTTSLTSLIASRRPNRNPLLFLLPILVVGRFLNAGLQYGAALLMDLPAGFVAGLSFVSAWPGVVLIALTIPPFARTFQHYRPARASSPEGT